MPSHYEFPKKNCDSTSAHARHDWLEPISERSAQWNDCAGVVYSRLDLDAPDEPALTLLYESITTAVRKVGQTESCTSLWMILNAVGSREMSGILYAAMEYMRADGYELVKKESPS